MDKKREEECSREGNGIHTDGSVRRTKKQSHCVAEDNGGVKECREFSARGQSIHGRESARPFLLAAVEVLEKLRARLRLPA